MEKVFASAGTLLAAVSVGAGAFGAYVLKERLTPGLIGSFETGARYGMYHALALLAVAWACNRWPGPLIQSAGWCFIAGTVIFSGSLYALALSGHRWWGAMTPAGGATLIVGWLLLFRGIWIS